MPTPEQRRIERDRSEPRLLALWWALQPLKSVVRFMQTGAHPDDETSGMLAALALRDGINISYACSTRGEGGQNDIGTEAGTDLGALRTREMERACDVLGMRMYWHSTHPEDSITDFGFSKSGEETLDRWGRERTLVRFAEIIRTEKPDIICPTFLDVPGQHGHHRAMTEAAFQAIDLAADTALSSNLPPWQVQKLYLPAWSGAGQSYDDDLPPPPPTLTVTGTDREPMTGWSWDRIGQQSRAYHRSQGMGRWVPAGHGRDWPLHLAKSHLHGPDDRLWSGLPHRLDDLASIEGAEPLTEPLAAGGSAIDEAIAAFPDFETVASHTAIALENVNRAVSDCPPQVAEQIKFRLEGKALQLSKVFQLALGVEARVMASNAFVEPSAETKLNEELDKGAADEVVAVWDLPEGWRHTEGLISVPDTAITHDPYPWRYDPLSPSVPCLRLKITSYGQTASVPIGIDPLLVVLPSLRAEISPTAMLINRLSYEKTVNLSLSGVDLGDPGLSLSLPRGWIKQPNGEGFSIEPPADVEQGVYEVGLLLNETAAQRATLIEYDHIDPTAQVQPAVAQIGIFDIGIPTSKIGYIGAGNDRVNHWLAAMGGDVTDITDDVLARDAALDAFDAIVVGIFALRFREGLAAAMPRLHRWAENGGTLVTLYHRPWDNWDPRGSAPFPLEIGQPSLRWRVTDEAADVTHLASHPILETPNRISEQDWSGWVKERGLYFAKSWDPVYTPLLSMADPGEEAHQGALLVADVGTGRHIHTSLILHHQMEHLVPGAFRLMANFVARRA